MASTQHVVKAAVPNSAKAAVHTAAVVTIDLCAVAGTKAMADGAGIPIWGFTLDLAPGAAGCGGALAQLPGPTLGLDTPTLTEGDTLTVNLENTLTEPVSINFHGQNTGGPPDLAGAPASGGTTSYSIASLKAGTYLYEAGRDVGNQIPMGLAGALVVHSASSNAAPAPAVVLNVDATAAQVDAGAHVYMLTENVPSEASAGAASATVVNDASHTSNDVTVPALSGPITSYNIYRTKAGVTLPTNSDWFLVASAQAPGVYHDITADSALGANPPPVQVYSTNATGANTTFNQEAVLVLSDIDPALNNAVSLGNPFDMLNYKPQYWLINGLSYPNTAPVVAGGLAGWRIDLRVVNAGVQQHTLMLLGAHATFVARDGFMINYPYDLDAETFAAGTTGDAIMTIPTGTASGAKFALFSRNMDLTNGPNVPLNTSYSPGGMMTFITEP